MNDSSALTYSTQPLHVRRDLFASTDTKAAEALTYLPYVAELCDHCGSRISLYWITFTGKEYLCVKCAGRGNAQDG
jgi:hypothetical protein